MATKVKGTTKSGFKFAIDSDVFKDWRFLRAVRKSGNSTGEEQIDAGFEMIELLFNDPKEEERFYEFLAEKHGGRVPADVVGPAAGALLRAVPAQSPPAPPCFSSLPFLLRPRLP